MCSAIAALKMLSDRAENIELRSGPAPEIEYLTQRLPEKIPPQRAGPIAFEIVDGKISVAKLASPALPGAERSAQRSREALIESGEHLLDAIRATNCDRRVLAVFEQLQARIISEENSISIGTWSLLAQTVVSGANEELPILVIALVEGYIAAISMFLAQHADWRSFSENALACSFGELQKRELYQTIKRVEKDLLARPDIAKAEVPATFRMLAEFMADPLKTNQKALFAGVRAIENLFAIIFRSASEFLALSAAQAIKQGADIAANVTVISATMAAIGWATGSQALISSIPEAVWIVAAAKLLAPAIKEFTKKKDD